MYGILFALLSAFSFGISNAYWRFAGKEDDFSRIVFYRGLLVTALFGISWWLLQGQAGFSGLFPLHTPGALDYVWSGLICLLCSFGLVFFLLSLRHNPVGISTALSSINVFSILTAVWIIGEQFHTGYLFAFIIATVGVLLCRPTVSIKKGWNKGLLLSLAASFCWGTGYALFRYATEWIGALPLSFLLECTVTLVALCWNQLAAPVQYRLSRRPAPAQWKHYIILALLLTAGTLCFNLAIRDTPVLLLNLTGNLSVVIAVLLGTGWHKERLTIYQAMGILFVIGSLVIVQLIRS